MATSSSWRIKIPESSADLGLLASPTCLPAAAAASTPSLKSSRERLPQSLELDYDGSVCRDGGSLGEISEDGRSATTCFLDTSASSAFVFPSSPGCDSRLSGNGVSVYRECLGVGLFSSSAERVSSFCALTVDTLSTCELPPRPECDGLSATTDGLLAVCESSALAPVSPAPFIRAAVHSANIEHVRCDTVDTPSLMNAASPSSPASPEHAEHPPVSPVSSNPSSLCDKLIRPEEIRQEKLLGRGGFGTVSLGYYKERKVVCKNFHSYIDDEVARETYERELKALEFDLDHENVVSVLGASSLQGWQPGACVVMSYAGSVTLESYLSDPRHEMTLQHMLFFTSHMMEGLSYLHSRGVLHLDLKPANCVFCPEEQTLRLCDLGALHVVGETWGSRIEGTVAFRAPELFSSQTPAPSFPCDVYSLAVTMWCLDSRQFPFESYPRECIIFNVVQNNLRPSVPVAETAMDSEGSSFVQQYRDLYTACWSAEPSLRPTLDEVMDAIYDIAEQL